MRACIGRCGLATSTNGKHPLPSTRNDPHLTTAGSSVACRRPHRRSKEDMLRTVLLLVLTSRSAAAARPAEASILSTNIAQLIRGDDALRGRLKPTHSVSSIIHVPSVTFMNGTALSSRWFAVHFGNGEAPPLGVDGAAAASSDKLFYSGTGFADKHHKSCLHADYFDGLPRTFKGEAYRENGGVVLIDEEYREAFGYNGVRKGERHAPSRTVPSERMN